MKVRSRNARRSGCPISIALEIFGDRWSLLIIRELFFHGPRSFVELENWGQERMSSKVLADRLRRLVDADVVARWEHVEPDRRWRYCLRPAGLELLPIVAGLAFWGCRHTAADPELSERWLRLERRGRRQVESMHLRPPRWRRFAQSRSGAPNGNK